MGGKHMPNASEFFEKNLKEFAKARAGKDEEKLNLYSGLAALAAEVEALEFKMRHLEGVLVHIQSLVAKNMP